MWEYAIEWTVMWPYDNPCWMYHRRPQGVRIALVPPLENPKENFPCAKIFFSMLPHVGAFILFIESFFTMGGGVFFSLWGLFSPGGGAFFSLCFFFHYIGGLFSLDVVLAFHHEGSLLPIMGGGGGGGLCMDLSHFQKFQGAPKSCVIIFITNNNVIMYYATKITFPTIIAIVWCWLWDLL